MEKISEEDVKCNCKGLIGNVKMYKMQKKSYQSQPQIKKIDEEDVKCMKKAEQH